MLLHTVSSLLGLPVGPSGKEPAYQGRRHKRHGFDSWVWKIPWGMEGQPTPAFLPGDSMDRVTWRATVHKLQIVGHN